MISLYCYENKINGKMYIGQTERTLEERYDSGCGYKGCKHFHNALIKYGIESFDRWILSLVETDEQSAQEEIFWIAEMRRTLGNHMVYNITDGGKRPPKNTKPNKTSFRKGDPSMPGTKTRFKKGDPNLPTATRFKKGQVSLKRKLSQDQREAIRNDPRSSRQIAKDYDVEKTVVLRIKRTYQSSNSF